METVFERGKEVPIIRSSDVVVLGGGPAGVSAAISAAKMGVDVTLIDTAPQIGCRESRRIIGEYYLEKKDLNIEFEDSISRANNIFSEPGKSISIPFRCLIPKRIDNLLYAGRCIAVSHEILDIVREIPCCIATGQAAGAAAALAIRRRVNLRDISIKELQDNLTAQNTIINNINIKVK